MRMRSCFLCDEPAIIWCGHVHNANDDHILAGWCETHKEVRAKAASAVFPFIAKAFPGRTEAQIELTKGAVPGCLGCYGPLPICDDDIVLAWETP